MRLVREAIDAEGRAGECVVAFSLKADLDGPESHDTVRLLSRAVADDPPDLILFETLSLVRPSLFCTVAAPLEEQVPVWVSFRRCRQGLCGLFGQHWGGPEGDTFGRAARRFEEMGVGALLVNCIPPDHDDGMVTYLRDFTDMPLGAYPNLGYLTADGWYFDPGSGEVYGERARRRDTAAPPRSRGRAGGARPAGSPRWVRRRLVPRAVGNTLTNAFPPRRGRPRVGRGGRPVSVGGGGALRRDRREPVPDAGRPVRAAHQPPAPSTTGAATLSTTCWAACRRRSRPTASRTCCTCRSCRNAERWSCSPSTV